MKFIKVILVMFLAAATLTMSSCSAKKQVPVYDELNIDEQYYYKEYEIVKYSACYPGFEDEKYKSLNEAILEYEVSHWNDLYFQICEQASNDIDMNDELSTFQRYLDAKYCVEEDSDGLSVIFDVEWLPGLANHEERYRRIYKLDGDFVYSTTIVSKRVY